MKSWQRFSGVFFLVIAAVVIQQSVWVLRLFDHGQPGSGFMPFGLGVILAVLAVMIFVTHMGPDEKRVPFWTPRAWLRPLLAVIIMGTYIVAFDDLVIACYRADLVYIGDFHALPRSQAFTAKLLEEIARRSRRAASTISATARDKQVLSFTGNEAAVTAGLSIGFVARGGKPAVLVNLPAAKAAGADLDAALLRVAEVIR